VQPDRFAIARFRRGEALQPQEVSDLFAHLVSLRGAPTRP
jgi:hypothetical protein